jgi:hypothetical protein
MYTWASNTHTHSHTHSQKHTHSLTVTHTCTNADTCPHVHTGAQHLKIEEYMETAPSQRVRAGGDSFTVLAGRPQFWARSVKYWKK